MLRAWTLCLGCLFLLVGLFGFWFGSLGYLVQLDLFQSFVYLIIGGVGLRLGLGHALPPARLRYLSFMAWFNLALLALGLTFPNFRDIVHLEIPEHIFHGLVGVATAIIASRNSH